MNDNNNSMNMLDSNYGNSSDTVVVKEGGEDDGPNHTGLEELEVRVQKYNDSAHDNDTNFEQYTNFQATRRN